MSDWPEISMPTRITQVDFPDGAGTLLRVEGSLTLEDARLLEKICADLRQQTSAPVAIDLSGLNFLDSESASVLCRLKQRAGVSLEGLHSFIQKVIEVAEESHYN